MLDKIKLIILDVDGVLTDGGIVIDGQGDEIKSFSAHDGAGIRYLYRAGLKAAVITGRKSAAVEARCRDLGIEDVHQKALEKLPPYNAILAKHGLRDEEVCYIGDDLMDLPPMRRCGFPVAVANARTEVRAAAAYVTVAQGGHGAVREVIDKVLKFQGKWDLIMARYRPDAKRAE